MVIQTNVFSQSSQEYLSYNHLKQQHTNQRSAPHKNIEMDLTEDQFDKETEANSLIQEEAIEGECCRQMELKQQINTS